MNISNELKLKYAIFLKLLPICVNKDLPADEIVDMAYQIAKLAKGYITTDLADAVEDEEIMLLDNNEVIQFLIGRL